MHLRNPEWAGKMDLKEMPKSLWIILGMVLIATVLVILAIINYIFSQGSKSI